ncbi:MAG: BMP family ABC transporter substrate-binding protein [Gammaproteobacteria bacterium]|nr:BMP family ABC transporter substrate-binding protein [Gammaproteobacteria bacterium]
MKNLFITITAALLAALCGQAIAATKVGYIYVGPRNDFGYNYAQDQGRIYLEENLPGVATVSFENIPENADVERVMERMIRSGVTVLFPTSYGYLDNALKVASKYPEVTFMHSGGFKLAPNLGTYFAGIDEAMYLAGVTAGAASKTGKLGFLAAHPIPQVLRNINAFTRGAQRVNPAITTTVVWTGTWSDPAKESEAANSLIDSGADVITGHVDSPITYTRVAEKRGVFSVGYHADASKFAPEGWLVGAIWNWGPMMVNIVKSVEDGSWISGHIRGGLKTGDSILSAYGPSVSSETQDQVAALQAEILTGAFNIWQGPILAQDGSEKAATGAVLSGTGLEGMDFLVQGVVGQVK